VPAIIKRTGFSKAASIELRPSFTPRSLAFAMPSVWRSRRMSFSNSAIRGEDNHDQLACADVVSIEARAPQITMEPARYQHL
jgi:hypothetical protein